MPWQPAAVCTILAMLVVAPAHAADEPTSSGQPRPFSVHLGLGSHLKEGGDVNATPIERFSAEPEKGGGIKSGQSSARIANR